MVTASLDGTKKVIEIVCDYEKEQVTVSYTTGTATPEEFFKLIRAMGYKVERVRPVSTPPTTEQQRVKAPPLPKDAPQFLLDAVQRAAAQPRALVLDFWATWCAPCVLLEKETLNDEAVKKLLTKVELVRIDLDKYPELAELYAVKSVPNVVFVDADGFIVDRLQRFEPPAEFARRLERLNGQKRPGKNARDQPTPGERRKGLDLAPGCRV